MVLSLLLLGPAGCGKSERMLGSNEIVRKPGSYRIKDKDLQIVVWIDNRIVHYRVVKSGQTIIESFDNPSTTQRWFLCWDANNQLWFDSSDIGGMLWRPQPATGKYTTIPITGDEILLRACQARCLDHWQRRSKTTGRIYANELLMKEAVPQKRLNLVGLEEGSLVLANRSGFLFSVRVLRANQA
jgi:hypothetical protein